MMLLSTNQIYTMLFKHVIRTLIHVTFQVGKLIYCLVHVTKILNRQPEPSTYGILGSHVKQKISIKCKYVNHKPRLVWILQSEGSPICCGTPTCLHRANLWEQMSHKSYWSFTHLPKGKVFRIHSKFRKQLRCEQWSFCMPGTPENCKRFCEPGRQKSHAFATDFGFCKACKAIMCRTRLGLEWLLIV